MNEHGHHHDRGVRGALRYLRHGRRMWSSPVNRAVIELVGPRSGELLVDLGSGMGPITVAAARQGAEVFAVDPTPFMRRILGGRRLLQRARGRIQVADGAAESIGVGDGQADAVVSVNTMHHWTDPDRAAIELHRVLRPGGRLVLVDEDFDDPGHELHATVGSRHHDDNDDGDHGNDHDEHDDDEHDHDHGMAMVDIDAMADRFRRAGFATVDAGRDTIGGQPCRRILATR